MAKDSIERNNWFNLESKDSNWLKRQWESIRNFLEWKQKADKIKVEEEVSENSEKLKQSAVDSTLENLNLDMEKWSEISDSEIEIKGELDQILHKWKKDIKQVPTHKEMSQRIINGRSPEVSQQISNSATKVEDEIKNWENEENPIARSLLKMANWLMNTEK